MNHIIDESKLGAPDAEIYYGKLNGDTVCTIVARNHESAMAAQRGATAPVIFMLITEGNSFWLGEDMYYNPSK